MIDSAAVFWIALLGASAVGVALWPQRGLLAQWQRHRRLHRRMMREDALKHIYKTEMEGRRPTVQSVAGILRLSLDRTSSQLAELEEQRLLSYLDGELRLTPAGEQAAVQVIRAHRLWEQYLAEETGVRESEWHVKAERQEHVLTPDQADLLSAQLGHPARDPHGDPIPARTGEPVAAGGRPLTTMPLEEPASIVHIEDEPEAIYARLAAEHLRPGMKVRVLEKSPESIRFDADGDEHEMALSLASNIAVLPMEEDENEGADPTEPLTVLRPGERGRVTAISKSCSGAGRRRLVDLGILPGTVIGAELASPTGDPTAYRVRGALLALRRDQAGSIRVVRLPDPS